MLVCIVSLYDTEQQGGSRLQAVTKEADTAKLCVSAKRNKLSHGGSILTAQPATSPADHAGVGAASIHITHSHIGAYMNYGQVWHSLVAAI